MKLTVKAGGVPAGKHVVKFQGLEQKAGFNGKAGLLWQFEVAVGPNAGGRVSGMTDLKPKPTTKCGRFLVGILGRPLKVGETVDLTPYLGKLYTIGVEQTDKGSRVVGIEAGPPV